MTKEYPISIYGGVLRIHVTENLEKTLKEIDYDGELECDACCVYNTNGSRMYDLVFIKGRVLHGLIAHECFHLTHRIMKHVNKTYDIDNDEPEAYLIQYLTDTVYSFFKENKIKVR